ncbi:MAG: metal ABC transporter permease, partial [Chloroflexota bacterium]|nr:metal ABC transporter permease [Chloroflexota bacterium]
MSWFTDPLQYEFFQRGLIVAILVGGLCGTIGTMIVLRRMSYIGHGLSHAVFGGAVVAYLMNVNFYLGAGLWGFLSALLINFTGKRRNIGADAAIGIVTTASFALGVALISRSRSFTRNFDAALFGNILGVTRTDILVILAVTVVVAVSAFVFYRYLLFTAFDAELAPVFGVPAGRVDALFALALAATIVASMNVVGVTLIAAAIVI